MPPLRFRTRVLDTAKRLAAAAAAPSVSEGTELTAVVVARPLVELLASDVVGAARTHRRSVEGRLGALCPQLELHDCVLVPRRVLKSRGD